MSLVRVIDTISHDRTYQRIECSPALLSAHLSLSLRRDIIISIETRNQLLFCLSTSASYLPSGFRGQQYSPQPQATGRHSAIIAVHCLPSGGWPEGQRGRRETRKRQL